MWEEYFVNLHLGVRKYLNKESEKSLPAARSKQTVLLAVHIIWQALVISLLWYIFASITGFGMILTAWAP
ncbi:jg12904, partial [Pararge aegeria aegeria]